MGRGLTPPPIYVMLPGMDYTTQAVCELLGVKRGTLYNIMRRVGMRPRRGQDAAVSPVGPIRNYFTPAQVCTLRRAQRKPKVRLSGSRPTDEELK